MIFMILNDRWTSFFGLNVASCRACLCSFQEMQEQFLPTDTVPSNAALCAYQQAGRWEDALELLEDMRKLEPKRKVEKNFGISLLCTK